MLWERLEPARAQQWARSEGIDTPTDDILDKEFPTAGEMRVVVARLCAAPDDVVDDRLARFIDGHQDSLDIRSRWLAHLALSQLAGGDALRLTRARDRALSELSGGLSLDRDVPGFIRARATGHGDLAVAAILAGELEQLWEQVGNSARKRSAIEAPQEITDCYVRRLFAYGFARLGQRGRAQALLEARDAADRGDPVHGSLLAMLDERVRQAMDGLAPTTPLSGELTARLNQLGTFERYKVDRLREASRILEPVERLDAVRGFQRGRPIRGATSSLRFVPWTPAPSSPNGSARSCSVLAHRACRRSSVPSSSTARWTSSSRFQSRKRRRCSSKWRGRSTASRCSTGRCCSRRRSCSAAHFGHESAHPTACRERLATVIGELDAARAADIGSVLEGALRTLRRVGLTERAAELLEAVAAVAEGEEPELLVTRVHVAGGLVFLGELARAEPLFAEARSMADRDMHIKERLELSRAISGAAALLPAERRVEELRAVSAHLPEISDSFSTNQPLLPVFASLPGIARHRAGSPRPRP